MMDTITVLAKKRRGPKPTGKGQQVVVRLQPDLLAKVDKAAKSEGVSRPEAIRRLIQRA